MSDESTQLALAELKEAVFGKQGTNGLRGDMARIKGHLFANPQTGEIGMIADLREIREMVTGIRGALRFLNWLIGSGVAVALLAVIRWYAGL